jgi:type III secretion system YscQ/HrcQ family protein
MMPSPLSAPKLTRSDVQAANAACRLAFVVSREFGLDLSVGGQAQAEDAIEVTVAVDSAELSVFVPASLLHHAARTYFALVRDYPVPESLVVATLEATVAPALARIEKAAGVQLALRRMNVAKPEAFVDAPLAFTIIGAAGGTVAVVPSPQLAMPRLAAPPWTESQSLPIALPLIVAELGLTIAEFDSLAVGDVLVLAGMSEADTKQVHLAISPAAGIIARIDGHSLSIERLGKSMSTSDAAPAARHTPATPARPGAAPAAGAAKTPVLAAASVEELPMRIVFDFGDLELTLAELKALVPGQVIDLARAPGSAVRMTVNGRRIGAGEIVEIDGRLGVRITELAGRNDGSTP